LEPCGELGDIEALRIDHRPVVLADGDDLAAVFFVEDLRDVVADVAEALNRDRLTGERSCEPGLLQGHRVAECFTQPEHDAASGGFTPPSDPALPQRLGCDAGPLFA